MRRGESLAVTGTGRLDAATAAVNNEREGVLELAVGPAEVGGAACLSQSVEESARSVARLLYGVECLSEVSERLGRAAVPAALPMVSMVCPNGPERVPMM